MFISQHRKSLMSQMSHVTNVTICIGMSRCRYNGTTHADSGNVKRWERERQTLVAFTAFSVF